MTTRSSTSTRSSVSISSDEDDEPEEESALYNLPNQGTRPSRSGVQQSMSSSADGDDQKWTRKTEANEGGRRVVILEEPDLIRVSIGRGDYVREVAESDATPLRDTDPEAYKLYQEYVGNQEDSGSATRSSGGTLPLDARDLMREQLRQMRNQGEIKGGPLDDFLRNLEQQLSN